jgi:sec-independent protein translocase protein TatB
MLFDLGWPEILLIGIVALVFIGPKDLPKAMRVAGYWMRKARTLSREFQSSIDQMIREAELEEVRQDLKKVAEFNLDKEFHNTIDPSGSLSESLKPPELPNFSETEASSRPVAEGVEPAIDAAAEQPVPLDPSSGDAAPSAQASSEPGSTEPAAGEPAPAANPLPVTGAHGFVPPQP